MRGLKVLLDQPEGASANEIISEAHPIEPIGFEFTVSSHQCVIAARVSPGIWLGYIVSSIPFQPRSNTSMRQPLA